MSESTGKRLNGLREIAEELSVLTVASVIDGESQVVRVVRRP